MEILNEFVFTYLNHTSPPMFRPYSMSRVETVAEATKHREKLRCYARADTEIHFDRQEKFLRSK